VTGKDMIMEYKAEVGRVVDGVAAGGDINEVESNSSWRHERDRWQQLVEMSTSRTAIAGGEKKGLESGSWWRYKRCGEQQLVGT
jgi:hypothetical protein